MNMQPSGFGVLPDVVKNLLILNVLLFAATYFAKNFGVDLTQLLGLHHWDAETFQPYQWITHMFMHGGIGHIFFNMFALWMFGSILERIWGPKRFFIYYMVTGLGAALLYSLVEYYRTGGGMSSIDVFLLQPNAGNLADLLQTHGDNMTSDFKNMLNALLTQLKNGADGSTALMDSAVQNVTQYKQSYAGYYNQHVAVGASGAVFGLLLAFGIMFPNELLYLYFAIPVKAKYFVIGYGLLELWLGVQNSATDNVAHFAHLGGMVFGFILLKLWGQKRLR